MRKNGSREGKRQRERERYRPAGLPEAPGEGRQIKEAVFLLKPPKAANDSCTGKKRDTESEERGGGERKGVASLPLNQ